MRELSPDGGSEPSHEDVEAKAEHRKLDSTALRRAQTDAQLVLERTLDTFSVLSDTAFRIVRLNAIVLTILVASSSQVQTARYLNALTGSAVLLFIASVLFAVVSYTSRRIEGGVGPSVLETTVDYRLSETEYLDWVLSEGYGNWIERGIEKNDYRERWIRYSLTAFLAGMTAFIAGTTLSLY